MERRHTIPPRRLIHSNPKPLSSTGTVGTIGPQINVQGALFTSAQVELLVSLQQQMTNAFATLTATMSKQSVDNELLVTHITSPPPPNRAPQDPHFERWGHPVEKPFPSRNG